VACLGLRAYRDSSFVNAAYYVRSGVRSTEDPYIWVAKRANSGSPQTLLLTPSAPALDRDAWCLHAPKDGGGEGRKIFLTLSPQAGHSLKIQKPPYIPSDEYIKPLFSLR
jgi:hypothetical protein